MLRATATRPRAIARRHCYWRFLLENRLVRVSNCCTLVLVSRVALLLLTNTLARFNSMRQRADPHSRNNYGETPLAMARTDALRQLLDEANYSNPAVPAHAPAAAAPIAVPVASAPNVSSVPVGAGSLPAQSIGGAAAPFVLPQESYSFSASYSSSSSSGTASYSSAGSRSPQQSFSNSIPTTFIGGSRYKSSGSATAAARAPPPELSINCKYDWEFDHPTLVGNGSYGKVRSGVFSQCLVGLLVCIVG